MTEQAHHPDLAPDQRATMPAMAGRARLEPDTAEYLSVLAGTVYLAAVEHTMAEGVYGLRTALMPAPAWGDNHDVRAAGHDPRAAMLGMFAEHDADRVHIMRGLATYAAQWYVAGALFTLEAVMTGRLVAPADVEKLLLNRNSHRPGPEVEVTLPVYGRHNRPAIPADPTVMTTGHPDLDTEVRRTWSDLFRTYSAAEHLEGRGTNPATPNNPTTLAAEGEVMALHSRLAAFGDAIADAARLGHAMPTRPRP